MHASKNRRYTVLQTKGIVIRTLRYAETSVITDIFTAEKGLCTFIAGGVRKARSNMPFSLFQAMTPVEIISYWKEDPEALQRLKECRAEQVLTSIPFDLGKGAVALFMAEVLRKCLHPGAEQPELFSFLKKNIEFLDATRQPVAHIHLHFLTNLTEFLGFQPQLPSTPSSLFFDLKEGKSSPYQPLHGYFLPPEQTRQLAALLYLPIEQIHTLQWAAPDRKNLLQKLIQYYQLHITGFGEIKTPDVLEMVFKS